MAYLKKGRAYFTALEVFKERQNAWNPKILILLFLHIPNMSS
jgi:hypothetical protein